MINWPDLKFPPINLWVIGADHRLFLRELEKNPSTDPFVMQARRKAELQLKQLENLSNQVKKYK